MKYHNCLLTIALLLSGILSSQISHSMFFMGKEEIDSWINDSDSEGTGLPGVSLFPLGSEDLSDWEDCLIPPEMMAPKKAEAPALDSKITGLPRGSLFSLGSEDPSDWEDYLSSPETMATEETEASALDIMERSPREDKILDPAGIFERTYAQLNSRENPKTLPRVAGDLRGREALLACAKISGDNNRQLMRLETIFSAICKGFSWENPETFLRIAEDPRGREALLACAKIPGDIKRQLMCLETIFSAVYKGFSWENRKDLLRVANDPLGREALLAYARIPGDNKRQLMCLETIFSAVCKGFSWENRKDLLRIAKDPLGREALLAYAKIPGKTQLGNRIQCLEAIFSAICKDFSWENPETFLRIAEDPRGREALLAYAKIPGETQLDNGIQCLGAIFSAICGDFSWENMEDLLRVAEDLRGREALLACAKIPGDNNRQLMCLETIFSAICGDFSWENPETFLRIVEDPLGREALLAYARIPSNTHRELMCLGAVFRENFRSISGGLTLQKIKKSNVCRVPIKIYRNIKKHCAFIDPLDDFLCKIIDGDPLEKAPPSRGKHQYGPTRGKTRFPRKSAA